MKRQTVSGKRKAGRFQFIGQTIAELRKAVWPTRQQEAIRLTLMVIAISAAVGLFLGFADFGFTELVQGLFLAGD